jgi:hypothetical protein
MKDFSKQIEEIMTVIREIDVRDKLDQQFKELTTNQKNMSMKTTGISNTLVQVKSHIERSSETV